MHENLKQTIDRTFDVYRHHSKGLYNFSLLFILISSIVISSWALLVTIAADRMWRFSDGENYLLSLIVHPFFGGLVEAYGYLLIAVYAVYLRLKQQETGTAASPADFAQKISRDTLTNFLCLSLLYTIVYLIAYDMPFQMKKDVYYGFDPVSDHSAASSKFREWANNFVALILEYSAVVLAAIIVILSYGEKLTPGIFKKFRKSLLIVLLLRFLVSAIVNNLIFHIDIYLIMLIKVGINDLFTLYLFTLFIHLLVLAFCYPAFASFLLFPIDFEARNPEDSKQVPEDGTQAEP